MKKILKKICLLLLINITYIPLQGSRDNGHFYRATRFFGETRLELPALTTFELSASGGATSKAINGCGHKVPLLDIYGTYNMHDLGVGVPGQDLNNPLDIILNQLALTTGDKNFAHLSFCGDFHITEFDFYYFQNIVEGFFFEAHVPYRIINTKDVCYKDLSPKGCAARDQEDIIWQAFLNNFDAILNRYGLRFDCNKEHGAGDTTLLLGWTMNYQETDVLDFVDLTIRSGVLCPTGKKGSQAIIFDLPLGYNGHWAIPIALDFAFGTYDWLTLGGHVGALFFFDETCNLRMKTNSNQQGMIKLAEGCATTDLGTLWEGGAYAKADHIVRGFSFWLGYQLIHQQSSQVTPADCYLFNKTVVNSDEMLKDWTMHTMHLAAEYDFTKDEAKVGPRLGFFYDFIVGGKRIYLTDMVGAYFGVEVAWTFN